MQLTELQRQIMELGAYIDSVLFGAIAYKDFDDGSSYYTIITGDTLDHIIDLKVLGHPMRYDRLCYLRFQKVLSDEQEKLWLQIEYGFIDDVCLYNQSILEWNEQTQLLVRDFLLSIQ